MPNLAEKRGVTEIDVQRLLEDVAVFVKTLKDRYGISPDEAIKLIEKGVSTGDDVLIPISIFNDKLGVLETTAKFLHDEQHLDVKRIAELLNRSDKTIYTSLHQAKKKFPFKLTMERSELVPASLFRDRKHGPLQLLCKYLHDECHLNYATIARKIQRDERTIWISYHAK